MSVGRASSASSLGVTLIELLIVIALVSLIAGISFPAVSSGLDTIRLSSACDRVASFLNSALNRAERRQQAIEITISKKENALTLNSIEPGFERKLEMPPGVSIAQVLPAIPPEANEPRRFIVMPGGTVPRIGIELVNGRRARRIVRIDPLTGVPEIERVNAP